MNASDIEKALSFIEDHLKQEYTLAELANYIGYSPFYFSREFHSQVGMPVMAYIRKRRLLSAADGVNDGGKILDIAIEYGFDTCAGFTRAFLHEFGCGPRQYRKHQLKPYHYVRKAHNMQSIVVRLISKEDVNDLWENIYSAMTPNDILKEKIIPSMEGYEQRDKIHLVAEVDGVVVGTLVFWRFNSFHPFGFLFDGVVHPDYSFHDVMTQLLLEMNRKAQAFGISTCAFYERVGFENDPVFESIGYRKVFTSDGLDYYMLSI